MGRYLIGITVVAIWVLSAASRLPAAEKEGGQAQASPGDQQAEAFTDKESSQLALFVAAKVNAGLRAQGLADAIHQRHAEIQKSHDAAKAAEKAKASGDKGSAGGANSSTGNQGKGDSGKTAQDKKAANPPLKQGLNDADQLSLGKFINQKLAEKLDGKELGDTVRSEVLRLQATHGAQNSNQGPSNPPATGAGKTDKTRKRG